MGACKQEKYGPMGVLQPFPDSIFILVKENNHRLPDSTLNRLYMVYYENGQKRYVSDFSRGINSFESLGIMETRNIGYISADKGIKNFYLEYAAGDVDTVYADFRRVTKEDGDNNCACEVPLVALKFNGKTAQTDSSLVDARIYIFRK